MLTSVFQLLFYQVNTGIMYQFTVPNNLTDYFMRNMIPNLRANPRNPPTGQNTNTQSNKQKDVHIITNPNELYKYRNTNYNKDLRPNSQTATQNRVSSDTRYRGSNTQNRVGDNQNRRTQYPDNRQKVYTYPEVQGTYKQAATGDYGQQSQSSNSISEQNTFYGRNGYPVYSNGIPANGIPLSKTADGTPLGGTANGIPLGGSANGIPLGGTVNKPPLLTANNVPNSKNYFWRISGFTECSKTCGGGKQIR